MAQYLIGNGLFLTALEFLAEGQELGGFDLTLLEVNLPFRRFLNRFQNFFRDTTRFPPEEVQRFQGEDGHSNL